MYTFTINNTRKTSENKFDILNSLIKCSNKFLKFLFKKNSITIYGIFVLIDEFNLTNNNLYLSSTFKIKTKILFSFKLFKYKLKFYRASIKYNDIPNDIHNKIFVNFINKDGYGFKKSVFFKKSSKVKKYNNLAIYFRSSKEHHAFLTKRKYNVTDKLIIKFKIFIAYFISILLPKNKILLYEKECLKYEESSKVLFEKLIDEGYKNCYFVIDKSAYKKVKINKKYKPYIIFKYSFKNYLYFFTCKSFIGTEFIFHLIDDRYKNKYVDKFINKKDYRFIFLQHGVMYAKSLENESRSFFKKEVYIKENDKIVVSSDLEKEGFIKYCDYNEDDFYITGLPKFDKSFKYNSANKIVIMLTWSSKEYFDIISDPLDTAYYKKLIRLYSYIPDKYKKDVILLPHPLFLNLVKDKSLFKIPHFISYDEILRNTSLLITDFSSISYDAFYRGANVIFYMDEVDEILNINKSNSIGDICKNKKELIASINSLYMNYQPDEYRSNFKKIVKHSDNKNTDRLVKKLKEDNII